LVILTAGIDLANAMIMVLGTLVIAKLAGSGGVPGLLALLIGAALCAALGAASGTLVTRLRLPPFIVTLGLLSVLTAVAQLYANGESFAVRSPVLTALGHRSYLFGRIEVTTGMAVLVVVVGGLWFALTQTAWGRNVRAIGDDQEAARLTGVNTRRTVLSVYVLAGLVYAIAAWQALGRIPNADPNAFQTGNLDSITAVVIGGTSLFGGRGFVKAALLGAMITQTIQNGIDLVGYSDAIKDIVTALILLAAVTLDTLSKKRLARSGR
jgi:fructose transport system permease protein